MNQEQCNVFGEFEKKLREKIFLNVDLDLNCDCDYAETVMICPLYSLLIMSLNMFKHLASGLGK